MLKVDLFNAHFEKLNSIYTKNESKAILQMLYEKENDITLTQNTVLRLNNALQDLLQHKPIQYILNEAWFYKYPFFVNEHVLIPRPETEQLVELVLQKINEKKIVNPNIVEIGTGSGCISICIKKECVNANITAIDISEKALNVAIKNAQLLNTEVNFMQMDFLQESNWSKLSNADFIVSNPPYIPLQEKNEMQKNVTEYEPSIALFVSNENPIIFYEKIAKLALQMKAIVCCEISEFKSDAVKYRMETFGFDTKILDDIDGKPRIVYGTLN